MITKCLITLTSLILLSVGVLNAERINLRKLTMTEENKTEPSVKADNIDRLALETAREVSPELLDRVGEIMSEDLTEPEKEQKINDLLKEVNLRANEIYNRKKQQGSD